MYVVNFLTEQDRMEFVPARMTGVVDPGAHHKDDAGTGVKDADILLTLASAELSDPPSYRPTPAAIAEATAGAAAMAKAAAAIAQTIHPKIGIAQRAATSGANHLSAPAAVPAAAIPMAISQRLIDIPNAGALKLDFQLRGVGALPFGEHFFRRFSRLCRAVAADDYSAALADDSGPAVGVLRGNLGPGKFGRGLARPVCGVTDRLIPLFAVGAFLAFTLGQAGMVAHWRKQGQPVIHCMLMNAVGAVATGITVLVVVPQVHRRCVGDSVFAAGHAVVNRGYIATI